MRKIFYLFTRITLALYFLQFIFTQTFADKPNVLFIAVDDLRPEIASYGAPAITPNMDRLASEGIQFNHHYVQYAVCIPSRVALLTSLRSERTGQNYGPSMWEKIEGAQSWGNTFKAAGYHTLALGKIWHYHTIAEPRTDQFDVIWAPSKKFTYAHPESQKGVMEFSRKRAEGIRPEDLRDLRPITEMADVPDTGYVDGKIAERAVKELKRVAKEEQPFMMAVGFVKPHLPFCAPKKYWDLYKEEDMELAKNPNLPTNMPEIAFNRHPNFFSYDYGDYPELIMGEQIDDRTARHLLHAYRAATSYVDAQIGKVLDQLKRLGLEKNTIVVLWSDHGFHLGDSGQWSKHSNFEIAARSPMMIKVPWLSEYKGENDSLVESVDILPTLLELCGAPPLKVQDGTSLVPILKGKKSSVKDAAYHIFRRGRTIDGERVEIYGHAVRTQRYRYVSWRIGLGMTGEEVAAELYDYEEDPYETRNVVENPKYNAVRAEMLHYLMEGPPGQFSLNK